MGMKFDEIKIGHKAEFDFQITPEMSALFVKITGDINSVHFGENAIVHGMLVASFISSFVGMLLPGDGAVLVANDIKFIRPVRINDDLKIFGRVAGKNHNNNQIELYIDIRDRRTTKEVIYSTCTVKVLK
jgi:acyl dehydratase